MKEDAGNERERQNKEKRATTSETWELMFSVCCSDVR